MDIKIYKFYFFYIQIYSKANSKFILVFYFELERMNFELFLFGFPSILGKPVTEMLGNSSILVLKRTRKKFQIASEYN